MGIADDPRTVEAPAAPKLRTASGRNGTGAPPQPPLLEHNVRCRTYRRDPGLRFESPVTRFWSRPPRMIPARGAGGEPTAAAAPLAESPVFRPTSKRKPRSDAVLALRRAVIGLAQPWQCRREREGTEIWMSSNDGVLGLDGRPRLRRVVLIRASSFAVVERRGRTLSVNSNHECCKVSRT
jgi:hypothetical protein